MSQRISPAEELLCADCGERGFDDTTECLFCSKPFIIAKVDCAADVARIGQFISAREEGDYGRERVYLEEALTKLTLRAIADGAQDPAAMAAAMLNILDEKAERLYG